MSPHQYDNPFDHEIDDIVDNAKLISKIKIVVLRERETNVIHCCVQNDNSDDLSKKELQNAA